MLSRFIATGGARRAFAAVVCAFMFAITPGAGRAQTAEVYKDSKASLEARVNDLFQRLTQDEKLSILTGTDFTTRAIPRLGVPAMEMADAGQGVRGGTTGTQGPATYFGGGVAIAASWDRELARAVGRAIGEEARNKGIGVQCMLGPAVNIHRSPLNGRNGEYMSEDPFVAAEMCVPYIQGLQSTGCAACVKHYACNNEEVDRGFVNVVVDERTLREIYLPAFEAAVKRGHVWTLMSSYNKVNGNHSSANWYLLTRVLRGDWGFDGMVMSDWGGVHETAGVVNSGNDLEMPGPGYLEHDKVAQALAAGLTSQQVIDDSVRRILRTVIRTGLLDARPAPDHAVVGSQEHRQVAYRIAAEGIVLLKNSGVLPFDHTKLKSVAVIGERGKGFQMGGGGSPDISAIHVTTPLQGITDRAGAAVKVGYAEGSSRGAAVPAAALTAPDGSAHGLRGEYFANVDLSGTPAATRIDGEMALDFSGSQRPAGIPATNFSVRWTGKITVPATGSYRFVVSADDGCRLFLDGKKLIDKWRADGGTPAEGSIDLTAGKAYDIRLDYFQGGGDAYVRLNWLVPGMPLYGDAVALAKRSDVAVVFVGSPRETEGADRADMELENGGADLIRAVAAANKRTIVVVNSGAPCRLSDWIDRVPGVIQASYPGQEGGAALADILFGTVNPSGKLTDTFAKVRTDYPDTPNFPGTNGAVHYTEGIYVGYRHFDKKQVEPLFPFGYGLSYTTFKYGNLRLSTPTLTANGSVTASVDVTNTGKRAGAEVVQLYMHPNAPKIDRAVRELKGFDRVALNPGETKTVTFTVEPRTFAYCDVPGKQWKSDVGSYDIEIGASSRDIRQKATLTLAADWTEAIPGIGEKDPNAPKPSLATGKKAIASSVEPDHDTKAGNATDGDPSTRWGSTFSDPQWLAIDLGAPTTFSRVQLQWEAAYGKAYEIQTSDDGQTWKTVYSTNEGKGGLDVIKFAPVTARWVRMYGTQRGTQYGYSLFSFDVN